MGVVEGEDKRRKMYDMMFGDSKETGGSGSVNTMTEWSKTSKTTLLKVMKDSIKRILGLRAKFGTNWRITIQTIDVKSAFLRIGVVPAGTAAIGYVVVDDVIVGMRSQFGWRGSPGWWRVVASAMQDALRKTTLETAVISEDCMEKLH